MGAKYTTVGMGFVHHDIFQVFQKVRPGLVIGQYAQVQHIRVGQDDSGLLANFTPLHRRRIAVKSSIVPGLKQFRVKHFPQTAQLVLRQEPWWGKDTAPG